MNWPINACSTWARAFILDFIGVSFTIGTLADSVMKWDDITLFTMGFLLIEPTRDLKAIASRDGMEELEEPP